ncbi:hypothetical protein [Kozakia baliensis]|uniref:hypothetical protein n=1 Tax=Kozakia baliensis TaxID=153496 RepID=UPI00087AB335|nr:hypothetical protein [Kozakia baliensis]AOX21534.1 hypothetical protein A0U90_13635 [Kozakia baliensis]
MKKTNLPPIASELAPRPKADLSKLRSPISASDQQVEENSRRLGAHWGATTSLDLSRSVPMASLRIVIPEYVDRDLALKAAEDRVTKQYLVLKALSEAGFRVDPQDLVEDKRKLRGR